MRYIRKIVKKKSKWGNGGDLWENKQLKTYFRNHFYDKCWYTECPIGGNDPHIDHFRPKARIIQFEKYNYNIPLANKGYFWLKNEPQNYRLSCAYANRKTGKGGKGNFFPLTKISPLLTPYGKEIEVPLLIDPCKREDVALITFNTGKVVSASTNKFDKDRVRISIKVFNLNNPYIVRHRISAWENIVKILKEYQTNNITRDCCLRQINDAISKKSDYSACAIACVNSLAPDELKASLNLSL